MQRLSIWAESGFIFNMWQEALVHCLQKYSTKLDLCVIACNVIVNVICSDCLHKRKWVFSISTCTCRSCDKNSCLHSSPHEVSTQLFIKCLFTDSNHYVGHKSLPPHQTTLRGSEAVSELWINAVRSIYSLIRLKRSTGTQWLIF